MHPVTRAARQGFVAACLAALISTPIGAEEPEQKAAVIEAGRTVSIEYTLTLDDGEVADTNVGGSPLTFQQGGGQLLPALEAELSGLEAGDTKEIDLSVEQGYGPVRDDLYQTIDIAQVPEEARTVGTMLMAQAPTGQQRPVRVHEVKEEQVVIDHNHPLAGRDLHFKVKVLSVE